MKQMGPFRPQKGDLVVFASRHGPSNHEPCLDTSKS